MTANFKNKFWVGMKEYAIMSLGLLLGVALNGAGLWENHGLGLALGALWGMALAVLFPAKDGSNAD